MAFTVHQKLKKPKDWEVTPLDETVAQYLFDLQTNSSSSELRSVLQQLSIYAAKEVPYGNEGKAAVVLFVPPPQLRDWRSVHGVLVEELQKKLASKHVLIVAQRRILPKESRKNPAKSSQKRPYSRTLTAVHEALLNDLIYPAEIVDRRVRVRMDGSKSQRVALDSREEANLEHKLDTFQGVYRALTGKDVAFSFQ
eukprot:TRINITY_DN55_c0_g1_i1.p1 TRINITY_DN55_c0_g1~~TRINITY_DN55_c0_g1_i1.p1  ORF type:complete len:196 (+),score=43.80 TRINITY_DN55_c0_g1_i1:69-656(+)